MTVFLSEDNVRWRLAIRRSSGARSFWLIKTQFAGDAGKMKAEMGNRMDEQTREMQTDPEKFVRKIRW